MKILVIDDDAVVARSVVRLLRKHHDDVRAETDVFVALAALDEADLGYEPFDLVVCDLTLDAHGGLTGLDVRAALRRFRTVPMFVLMTGHDLDADDNLDAIVMKPFTASALDAAIEVACAHHLAAKTRPLRIFRELAVA